MSCEGTWVGVGASSDAWTDAEYRPSEGSETIWDAGATTWDLGTTFWDFIPPNEWENPCQA